MERLMKKYYKFKEQFARSKINTEENLFENAFGLFLVFVAFFELRDTERWNRNWKNK